MVGRPPECRGGCRSVVVRYIPPAPATHGDDGVAPAPSASQPQTGILVLPQQTLMQRGDRVLAEVDPSIPGRLRALRPPQRVSPDSLFGAMAAIGGLTGTALLVLASRTPRPHLLDPSR